LENNQVDEETREFRKFLSDEMGNLRRIFCQSPNIGDRTENQVNNEIRKEIEKMSTLARTTRWAILAYVGQFRIGTGDEALPRTQPVKNEWCHSVEYRI
jgi:hypothetical protein